MKFYVYCWEDNVGMLWPCTRSGLRAVWDDQDWTEEDLADVIWGWTHDEVTANTVALTPSWHIVEVEL